MEQNDDELVALIERVTGNALFPQGAWDSDNDRFVAAAKNALDAHADAGGFSTWGVTSRDQLAGMHIAVGFDSDLHTFVINPEALADWLIERGRPLSAAPSSPA